MRKENHTYYFSVEGETPSLSVWLIIKNILYDCGLIND